MPNIHPGPDDPIYAHVPVLVMQQGSFRLTKARVLTSRRYMMDWWGGEPYTGRDYLVYDYDIPGAAQKPRKSLT